MADIDRFKDFNDTYGHEAGDCVLAAVAEKFRNACRPYDVVGRYGGEEFVVLLPANAAPEALFVAERVRAGVEGARVSYNGMELRVTVSIGAASLEARGICEAQTLLRAADHALYRAKAAGRNRVCQATPDDLGKSPVDQERIVP
jgi:diguanylate cyclase (GGDEF)-like protein